jgi:hypothetical protein
MYIYVYIIYLSICIYTYIYIHIYIHIYRKSFGTGVRPEGCDTVFVGNLPFDVEEDQLKEVFADAGIYIYVYTYMYI